MMSMRYGEACRVDVVSQKAESHAGTLTPRLGASAALAGSILADLRGRRRELGSANCALARDCTAGGGTGTPPSDGPLGRGLDAEHLVCQAADSVGCIRARIAGAARLSAIPPALAPTIPVARTLSAGLFDLAPGCSRRLCGLAEGLGSIVMDSAVLAGASLDFGTAAAESSRILHEAKLTADSKMRQSYPDVWGRPS